MGNTVAVTVTVLGGSSGPSTASAGGPRSGGGRGEGRAGACRWSSARSVTDGARAGIPCVSIAMPALGGSVRRLTPVSIGCAWIWVYGRSGAGCFDARCAGSCDVRGSKRSTVARAVASRHGASVSARRPKPKAKREPRPRRGPSAIPRTETGSGPSAWCFRRHRGATSAARGAARRLPGGPGPGKGPRRPQPKPPSPRRAARTAARNCNDPRLALDSACLASWETLRGRRPRVGPQRPLALSGDVGRGRSAAMGRRLAPQTACAWGRSTPTLAPCRQRTGHASNYASGELGMPAPRLVSEA